MMSGMPRGLIACAVLLTTAYAVAMGGRTLDVHNADSLIPVFVSLDYWQPFYWGQDRFGMLLALVAATIRDSFWNLVAQNLLSVLLLSAGALAVARQCGLSAPLLAPLVLLIVVLAWPADKAVLQLLTTNQSYGPALGLYGLASLVAWRGTRAAHAAAVLLMVLGTWTNAGTGLLMFSVATVGMCSARVRQYARPLLVGTVIALAVHVVLQRVAPGTRVDVSHLTVAGLGTAGEALARFWGKAYIELFGPAVWALLGLAGVLLAFERQRPVARDALLACLVGSALYGLGMTFFFGAEGRHASPILPLLLFAVIVGFLRHATVGPRVAAALATGLAAVVIAQSDIEWPQSARRALIERMTHGHGARLYELGVTVVTGDYWFAWPYTFGLNMLHERVSGTRPVFAVALRGEDLYERRAPSIVPGTRIAVVPRSDYFYWTHRGPDVTLETIRLTEDYEVARVLERADREGARAEPRDRRLIARAGR
jgi:hypothetical protein